jgi:hypothetical protein
MHLLSELRVKIEELNFSVLPLNRKTITIKGPLLMDFTTNGH